jgi:hypothetical protein
VAEVAAELGVNKATAFHRREDRGRDDRDDDLDLGVDSPDSLITTFIITIITMFIA